MKTSVSSAWFGPLRKGWRGSPKPVMTLFTTPKLRSKMKENITARASGAVITGIKYRTRQIARPRRGLLSRRANPRPRMVLAPTPPMAK